MDNPSINNKSKQKPENEFLNYSLKNTLTANKLSQYIDKIDIEIQLEKPLYYIKKQMITQLARHYLIHHKAE